MSEKNYKHCKYLYSNDSHCLEEAGENGLCFWHDPDIPKNEKDIKERLEQRCKNQQPIEGFSLKKANLEGISWVKKNGLNAKKVDLYRANLKGGHFFNINFEGSNLMKSDFSYSNLNNAKLKNTNLLGINLEHAKLEGTDFGDIVLQEHQAKQAYNSSDKKEALALFRESEEIYRSLRKATEERGQFMTAGKFFYREMTMRRYQLPLFSVDRLLSKIVDLFCGYAEKPLRVILFSLGLIFGCALLYLVFGINDGNQEIIFNIKHGIWPNIQYLADCVYFSIVTFTTLGYGDITPLGISRFVAAFEAFTGAFTMALFVVVFVKKMTH